MISLVVSASHESAGFFHSEAQKLPLYSWEDGCPAPGLLNHALVTTWRGSLILSNLYVSQRETLILASCVSGPWTNFCVWKNMLLFSRFRLDLVSLSPARESEESTKMESFTRKMGMVRGLDIDKKYLSETRKAIAQPILLYPRMVMFRSKTGSCKVPMHPRVRLG